MEKIFVTGVNGLLGTNLVNTLLERGFYVIGLVRNRAKYHGSVSKNLELVEGGLTDDSIETLVPILMDCDYIVHVAAETSQSMLRYSDYRKINYEATVHLFEAAVMCNIKRFIFVSTANTLGYGSCNRVNDFQGNSGSELAGIRAPFDKSFYAQSKREAEIYLLENKHRTDVIIVNPTFMLGAYDSKPGSGKIITMFWKKPVIFYPPGGKNFVHVADVADSIIKSFSQGINGEKYLLANENLSYREFFEKLNTQTKRNSLMIKIPAFVLLFLGFIGDIIRIFNIKTSISSVNMKILCIYNFYSNKKSVADLHVTYQPIDMAISDAIKYFMRKGE
ncbi:MAG: dihydroflavonol 4-reductase [Bacteroidetes bacterium GWF2_40_14]|nr:MAG: dihydroflavonol 4-reductase [Bacteroidetes bacterium GWF2_40_14]